MSNLITYKIENDLDGKLKAAARTACNFWNRFVDPKSSVVVRFGVFEESSSTIALAWEPYKRKGLVYGRVKLNAKYLKRYGAKGTVGTIIHEMGHTLGFGWQKWEKLYSSDTGKFTPKSVKALPALEKMRVETDGGEGTEYSHWDEETFDRELMTGYEDRAEHVLPVTIDVMKLLGHDVKATLEKKTSLNSLIKDSANVVFKRKAEAKKLDLDYFEETKLLERVPHVPKRRPRRSAAGR